MLKNIDTTVPRVALVTGSAKGIGKAIALALARSNITVVVTDLPSMSGIGKETLMELQECGIGRFFPADISQYDDILSLREFVLDSFGRLDILVNNAGVIVRPAEWNLITPEGLDYTLNVNLKSIIYLYQSFVPLMIEQHFGRIVNISSLYGLTGAASVLAYTATKAAVANMTYSMARELGKHNITVNAVAPGHIDTEMTRSAGQEFIEWAIKTTPLARLGKPEEIADAVLYLINSSYVTGHVLVVDGGHGGHV